MTNTDSEHPTISKSQRLRGSLSESVTPSLSPSVIGSPSQPLDIPASHAIVESEGEAAMQSQTRQVTVRLTEDDYRHLRVSAAQRLMTMQDYLTILIKKDQPELEIDPNSIRGSI